VLAHRLDRRGHLAGDVEDRPGRPGRVRRDRVGDRGHRDRETDGVVCRLRVDRDGVGRSGAGGVGRDRPVAVGERHARVDRRAVGCEGVCHPAADLARADDEQIHSSESTAREG
jgi:hypothetical protein